MLNQTIEEVLGEIIKGGRTPQFGRTLGTPAAYIEFVELLHECNHTPNDANPQREFAAELGNPPDKTAVPQTKGGVVTGFEGGKTSDPHRKPVGVEKAASSE